ncbi:hypothetical protein NFG57_11150 [Halomonas sp. H10-59]|uniref:Uncharacterized protein n=1 Tax=Halomonas sp. H10-59 TaxID=2950874 RepID=A0AAU7KPK5_9GAMM
MSFSTNEMLQLAKRELGFSMARWSSLPTMESLDMAIEEIKLEGGNWPPSIAELCRIFKPSLKDFGLPEPEIAFREACTYAGRIMEHHWSHQAVMDATTATGSWDLRHCSSEGERYRLRKVFFAEYEALCNRLLEGGELDDRVALLESDEMKSDIRKAQEASERKAQQEAEDFWRTRGEEPPKSTEETIARIKGILAEGGDA